MTPYRAWTTQQALAALQLLINGEHRLHVPPQATDADMVLGDVIDERDALVALLRDCGAVIGSPEDHRPTGDDGLHALATRIAVALAPHWQLPDDTGGRSAMDLSDRDDGPCQCEECRAERNRTI